MSYLKDFLFYLFLFLIVYIPVIIRKKRIKRISNKQLVADVLFFGYIIFILSLTVLPTVNINLFNGFDISLVFPYGQIVELSADGVRTYSEWTLERTLQLKPFNTIINFLNGNYSNDMPQRVALLRIIKNIIGNIALFVPFGFIYPLRKSSTFGKTLGFGLAFIILIEAIQYFIGRVADIDDVILNVIGVAVGYLLYKISKYILSAIKNKI